MINMNVDEFKLKIHKIKFWFLVLVKKRLKFNMCYIKLWLIIVIT
jgi:hypothetical protein